MSELSELLGKEIIVVGEDEINGISELFATDNLRDIEIHIKSQDISEEIKAFHGIVYPAKYIPSCLSGASIFLIYQDATDSTTGFVYECSGINTEEIAKEITEIVCNGMTSGNIKDFYLLYGQEISLSMSIEYEEIDEGLADSCKRLCEEITRLKEFSEGL